MNLFKNKELTVCISGFSDGFYKFGLQRFFNHFFDGVKVVFQDNIEINHNADIVIFPMDKNKRACHSALKSKETTSLICIADKKDSEHKNIFFQTQCQNVNFLFRETSVDEFFLHIKNVILNASRLPQASYFRKCKACAKCKIVTPMQKKILSEFMQGKHVSEIASMFGISHKTVYSHKKSVMLKFNLHNTKDLYDFSKKLLTM